MKQNNRDRAMPLPPPAPLPHPGVLLPAREIVAKTKAATILFARDEFDTTYVTGRRGLMVLFLVADKRSYQVGRYDDASGKWRVLSQGWPRFGNALAFACAFVS